MIAVLDTSVLIKLYIDEPGSTAVQEEVGQNLVAASPLTYAEAHATFARRLRESWLESKEYELVTTHFDKDWGTVLQVPTTAEVLRHVPDLCRRHPLRGADALQLASAILLHTEGIELTFMASDRRLLAAAQAEGLQVFDPLATESEAP